MVDWIRSVMDSLGYSGIALLMFLENLFPPLPSEVVMPLAGFSASGGRLSLVGLVAAGAAGSLLGALAWYFAGRLYGGDRLRRLADRHGQWLGLSPRDIDEATAWFARYGRWAVLIGRLVPGVRTLISVPAGVCGMPLMPFLLYSAIGTLAWTLALAYAGVLLEENWSLVGDYLGPIGYVVLAAIVLWFAVRLIRARRRPAKGEPPPATSVGLAAGRRRRPAHTLFKEDGMKVGEVMTREVEVVAPGDTIQRAAKMMDDLNIGVLPVCDGERLVGMITDRDITVRATSVGKAPGSCKVEEVMTTEVNFCLEDDSVEDAAKRMKARQIRRLPVLNRDSHRMVGIVALGDLATDVERDEVVADTLEEISEPSRPDRS